MLRLTTRGLHRGLCLKALVDGATAALQHAPTTGSEEAVRRLAVNLGVDRREIELLVAGRTSPLGRATRLFTLVGAHQLRVTPDDHLCVAAEVISAGPTGPPREVLLRARSERRSAVGGDRLGVCPSR